MILQNSFANKQQSKYDFKRCLTGLIPAADISFLFSVFFFVIMPLKEIFLNTVIVNGKVDYGTLKNDFTCILYPSSTMTVYMGIFAVIIGVFFAFSAFYSLMRKNSVNFYFSIGINRKTYFKNRALASLLLIFGSVMLPIICDIIINIHYFGNAGYIIYQGILLLFEHFTYITVGFSIMAVSMTVCYNVIESLLLGASLLWLPTACVGIVTTSAQNFLRGFTLDFGISAGTSNDFSMLSRTTVFNPLFFGKALGNHTVDDNLYSYSYRYSKSGSYSTLEGVNRGVQKAGSEYIIPVIIWLAVSAILIFVAANILKKRKLEKTGLYGVSPFCTGAVSFFASIVGSAFVLWVLNSYYIVENTVLNNLIKSIIAIACAVIVYYLFTAILRRTLKVGRAYLNSLLISAAIVLSIVTVCCFGAFGYTRYAPDYDKIEYASISSDYTDASGCMGTNVFSNSFIGEGIGYYGTGGYLGRFCNKENYEKIKELQSSAADVTDDMTGGSVSIKYVLKNGTTVYRSYSKTDSAVQDKIIELTETDEYKAELEYLLSSDKKDQKSSGKYDDIDEFNYSDMSYFRTETEASVKKCYHMGEAIIVSSDGVTKNAIKNTDDLRDALLADLETVGYKRLISSDEKTLGAIVFRSTYDYISDGTADEYEGELADYVREVQLTASVSSFPFYITADMENTVNYLKSTGEYKFFNKSNLGEIKYAEVIPVKVMADYLNLSENNELDLIFETTSINENLDNQYYEYEDPTSFLESDTGKLFAKSGQKISDKAELEDIFEISKIYSKTDINDYLVIIVYDNSTIVYRYMKAQDKPDYIK